MAIIEPSARLVPAGRLAERARAREQARLDVQSLERALRADVRGEVRFDDASRALYAQDASNYRRIPLGVVIPESKEDVVRLVEVCRAHGAPIAPRGGGTALAGQTVNEAVVVDFSKRMGRILGIDPIARTARVEPGVVCDDLTGAVAPLGLTFGPKPATHSRCCFGGMLANNCGGMQAQMNGTAVDNVEAMEALLYDGTRVELGWTTEDALESAVARGGPTATLFARLRALRDRYAERIRAGYPKLPRRISGYNLDQLLPDADGRMNLARLLVGSEGTLATMLEATVRLIPDPPVHAVVALGFGSLHAAAEAVPSLLPLRPLALEGMDDVLRDLIEKKGGEHAKHLGLLGRGSAWLLVELGAPTEDEVKDRAEEAVRAVRSHLVGHRVYLDAADRQRLWDAREGGLGATAFVPGEPDTWPGWEDSAVPTERLAHYLRDLRKLFDRYDYHPALYGHFGMGLVHCRVPFDLYDEEGVAKFRWFMGDAADLVVSYGGSLSGEHGDGQARAELLVKMFGPELMTAMRELKAIFDPAGRMNPGKIVDPYPIVDHMRLWPGYAPAPVKTHFRFPDDGGSFDRAALRCVGVGLCRRKSGEGDHDVMCPSYMVTHEEKYTTRGRAHLLWEMLRGDGPVQGGWNDEGVKDALDLCLACKGCKGDCPVNVDMATYKAEFLSHYYEGRARPRHAYAFGYLDRWARAAEIWPDLVNAVTQLPGLRALAKLAAGVSQESTIPAFAPETFRSAFARRPAAAHREKKVVLWPDTFNDHFRPDTAMAAVDVLEAAGFEVVVPRARMCCGRPLYDFGMLDRARGYLAEVLVQMRPHLLARTPIVVLEPSCASVFRDELPNLMPDREDAAILREQTTLLSELLAREGDGLRLPTVARRAIVQGHCHHKSVLGWDDEKTVLSALGLDAEVLSSGCCGMAGAFGFVAETHDVGAACGERSLLPRVRSADDATFVIADGFSCREQIEQRTDRRALHLAEVVQMGLAGDVPSAGERPEARVEARRRALARRSTLRGALSLGLLFGGAALGVAAAIRWARR